MSTKAGPSFSGTWGQEASSTQPTFLPHFWDFPKENTDAPFILSFPIIHIYSFPHQTTYPFWSSAPGFFPVQWERRSLNPEPAAGLCWRASGGCGRPKECGRSMPVGDTVGTGGCTSRRDSSVSAKEKMGPFWPCRFYLWRGP